MKRAHSVRRVLFVGLQLVSGLLSFVAWGGLSHTLVESDYVGAVRVLTVGLALYLPLTAGLPFMLANYFRGQANGRYSARASSSLVIGVVTIVTLSVGGFLLFAFAWLSGGNDWIGLTVLVSGSAVGSAYLQQVARLENKLSWLVLASVTGTALPVVWTLIGVAVTGDRGQHLAVALAYLALCAAIAVVLCRLPIWQRRLEDLVRAARMVVVAAAPLIPHLIAFGWLTQGIRLTSSVFPSAHQAVTRANYFMLFAGVGFALIAGMHGLLGVAIQRAESPSLPSTVRRAAFGYAATGVLTSSLIVVLYVSPVRLLFRGFQVFDGLTAAGICFVSAIFCSYYFSSTILLRWGLAPEIAFGSVGAVLVMFLGAFLLPRVYADAVILYAVSLMALLMYVSLRALLAARKRSVEGVGRSIAISWTPLAIPLIVGAIVWVSPVL